MERAIDPHVLPNSTFIIDQNRTVEYLFGALFTPVGSTVPEAYVPNNVTLIFQGGKITSSQSCRIVGANTRIIAPIAPIFGDNIEATGSWVIDRAYPQWFGFTPLTGLTNYMNDSAPDAGVPINKAIQMKKSGEVFLPKGFYPIQTPIIMYVGIKLVGEFGMGVVEYDYMHYGTVLQSWKNDQTTPLTDSSNRYMLYFNSLPDLDPNTGKPYIRLIGPNDGSGFKAGQVSEIRNITFYNHVPVPANVQTTTGCLKGLYAADSLSLENVRFEQFRQAVVFRDDMYIDSRRIVNCAAYTGGQNLEGLSKDIYAFDLGFLGDNLLFEHNSVDGFSNKGIKLSNCYGGRISCNIINADCQFTNCRALTFSNNHIEEGKQIEVISSDMKFEGNYYEKRYVPSVKVRGANWDNRSTVSFINESFMFVENDRLIDTPEYNTVYATIVIPPKGIPSEFATEDDYKKYMALKQLSGELCEYDIDIDSQSEINLSNVYRFRNTINVAGQMRPTGISIRKTDYTFDENNQVTNEIHQDFAEFNNFSYMLSKHGLITPGYHIVKNFTVNGIQESFGIEIYPSNDMMWMEITGVCSYKFQIIWDKQRPLVGNMNGQQIGEATYAPGVTGSVTMGAHSGIFLALAQAGELNGNHKMLRIYRFIRVFSIVQKMHFVDIPLTGTMSLFDNGISINGYKWKTYNGLIETHSLKGDEGLESITFEGSHVKCRTSTAEANLNAHTQWQRGDELLYVGPDPYSDWGEKVIK